MKDLSKIIKEAKQALKHINDGQTYTSGYIVNRFKEASETYPQDQLINNMKEVFEKRASKQLFFSQKEVSSLYNEMYGFSGGQTAFRTALGDLLPENMQISKVAYKNSNLRTQEEIHPEPLHKESELSNAFSLLFSLGNDSSIATYKQVDNKMVEKAVMSKLSSLGKTPVKISVATQNEHFALATALYQDRNHKQLAVQIPVQISNGKVSEPTLMVQGSETVSLTKEGLYAHLKESNHYKKVTAKEYLGGDSGKQSVEADKVIVPASLDKIANFDTNMIKAASYFTPDQVNLGMSMLSGELAAYTNMKSQIKVANSNQHGIIFSAIFPSPKGGNVMIDVPVEYHNNKPILPSKFAVNNSIDAKVYSYYDFNEKGFKDLWAHVEKDKDNLNKIARVNSPMGEMSYHQLMDRIITAAATKDFQDAEDAIGVISEKFGPEMAKEALGKYANLLKYASPLSDKRSEFVKMAEKKGQLIKIPTTVELYNPKLGLPVSKIDFDHEGNMFPRGRAPKYDNLNDDVPLISTSKIVLS